MTPFRTLDPTTRAKLRDDYAAHMATQRNTCSMDEKIARFAAWLAPQGISFDAEDLKAR